MVEIMQNLINESRAEGSHETTIAIAKKLLTIGISVEDIIKTTNLPLETVLKLQSELLLS